MRKKIGVLTSGGDTTAMNAAIKAVVMAAELSTKTSMRRCKRKKYSVRN